MRAIQRALCHKRVRERCQYKHRATTRAIQHAQNDGRFARAVSQITHKWEGCASDILNLGNTPTRAIRHAQLDERAACAIISKWTSCHNEIPKKLMPEATLNHRPNSNWKRLCPCHEEIGLWQFQLATHWKSKNMFVFNLLSFSSSPKTSQTHHQFCRNRMRLVFHRHGMFPKHDF